MRSDTELVVAGFNEEPLTDEEEERLDEIHLERARASLEHFAAGAARFAAELRARRAADAALCQAKAKAAKERGEYAGAETDLPTCVW